MKDNPFKFDDEIISSRDTDPRILEKTIESTNIIWKVLGGTMWLLSSLLTFGFGASWLAPLFSDVLSQVFPVAGVHLAKIGGGVFMAITFDIGALIALWTYIYSTETLEQQDIAKRLLWVDFTGGIVASIAQMVFSLSGVIVTIPLAAVNGMGWFILLTTICVFSFNLYQSVLFKLSSIQVMRARHEAEQRAEAISRAQKREKAQAEIARQMADERNEDQVKVWRMVGNNMKEHRRNIADQLATERANALKLEMAQREGVTIPISTSVELPAIAAATSPPDTTAVLLRKVESESDLVSGENFQQANR